MTITPFRFVYSFLVVAGSFIVSAACSKQHEMNNVIVMQDSIINADPSSSPGTKKYLALGDSYTIGTSVMEADRYPVQTVGLLKAAGIMLANAEIIATNGWTTGDLLAAIHDKPAANNYDAVSVLIGVNNQYRGSSLDQYKQEFTSILQRAIQLAAGKPAHVVVLSIPDYSVTPFASGSDREKIAKEIDAFNEVNRKIATDFKVSYLYITDDSRKAAADPSLVAGDGLHFSGKEYAVWSAKLAPVIKTMLQ